MTTHNPSRDSASSVGRQGCQDAEIQKPKTAEELEKCAQRITDFYCTLFKGLGLASTLGASITFAAIVQQLDGETAREPGKWLSYNQAQLFSGISWVLFVGALGGSGLSLALVQYFKAKMARSIIQCETHWFEKAALWALLLVQGLVAAASITSSLVVTAYTSTPGYCGVVLITAFTFLAFLLWVYHYR
jgi:hypothetical protein